MKILLILVSTIILFNCINSIILNKLNETQSEPLYDVKFMSVHDLPRRLNKLKTYRIRDIDGTSRICYLPKIVKKKKLDSEGSQVDEDSLNIALHKFNTKCYYRIDGWWIYELCHNSHVRQYHQEKGKIQIQYMLGKSKSKDEIQKYLVHLDKNSPIDSYVYTRYFDGSTCKLNNKKRETESKFFYHLTFKIS